LAFFDLETTGTNIGKDRIVEISILKVMPDGEKKTKTMRFNPTIPIPNEVSLIHGIYDVDVANSPTFAQQAGNIAAYIENCDLAGYNSNKFDIPMLLEEFLRAGIDFPIKNRKFVDVQNIFHIMEKRTLEAAYKFYCDKKLENAHSAESDVMATYEVFMSQLQRYADTEITDKTGKTVKPVVNDINALAEFTKMNDNADPSGRLVYNTKGEETINFGKYKGMVAEEVFKKDPGYYSWMMDGDFPMYTKKLITEIKLRGVGK
jgi:DNA polymerase-3 subunit epsilon